MIIKQEVKRLYGDDWEELKNQAASHLVYGDWWLETWMESENVDPKDIDTWHTIQLTQLIKPE